MRDFDTLAQHIYGAGLHLYREQALRQVGFGDVETIVLPSVGLSTLSHGSTEMPPASHGLGMDSWCFVVTVPSLLRWSAV